MSEEECINILTNEPRGVLALLGDNNYPYAIPMSHVYVDGKRKEIAGKTEDDVYESLYKHYSSLEESPKTLSDVFELLKDRKLNELARSEKTIREDVRLFNHLSESLRNKDLVEITESDIRKWLVKE